MYNTEATNRAWDIPCGICDGQSATGTGFSQSSSIFACQYRYTVALHTHAGIIWGMNSRPVGGRSSETSYHPIDMNMDNFTEWSWILLEKPVARYARLVKKFPTVHGTWRLITVSQQPATGPYPELHESNQYLLYFIHIVFNIITSMPVSSEWSPPFIYST
jgi:hypothetical protein